MNKKIKTGTMMYKSIIKLCDDNKKIANANSRNDFIEKAIKHYVGYLHKDDNTKYLNSLIDETLNAKINLLDEHLSAVIFKLSVELNVLTYIVGATTDIDIQTLKKIRIKSIEEVKRTLGKIDLEEIFSSYSMEEGD